MIPYDAQRMFVFAWIIYLQRMANQYRDNVCPKEDVANGTINCNMAVIDRNNINGQPIRQQCPSRVAMAELIVIIAI